MCFSAPVSFIAGTVLSSAGVVTIKQAKKPREIPLALIPLFFGIQQFIEGFVWLAHNWDMPSLNVLATYSFVVFALVLWPIYIPIAVFLVEKKHWRRRAITICGLVGASVSLYLLAKILIFPVSSQIVGHSINYILPSLNFSILWQALFYIIPTCVSALFSSHRYIRLLGIATIIFLGISYYFYTVTFASVWCFFAALLSLIIYFHFKK